MSLKNLYFNLSRLEEQRINKIKQSNKIKELAKVIMCSYMMLTLGWSQMRLFTGYWIHCHIIMCCYFI